ncbi:MAG: DNA replication and repair protein RecF, partial [Anaerolineaceae bacterium]|nr:DNA replication and repair protein RecF [Anaerolineaceae bacterium]
MIIRRLSLTKFRIFRRLEMEFPSNLNILVGQNAQGKTSILEAVHTLTLMTSPIAGNDREMVSFLALHDEISVGRLIAEIEKNSKMHRIEVRLIIGNGINSARRLRKEVIIDGAKKKLLDAVGYFNSVIFLPQMTRIIEDGPDERRKYLDRTLSQTFKSYVRALSAYNQGITHRNALLKQLFERGGNHDQLAYWDELIAENGAVIMQARKKVIQYLSLNMQEQYKKLSHGHERIKLSYIPSLNTVSEKNSPKEFDFSRNAFINLETKTIKELFLKQLKDRRKEEIRRGMTTIGPHRDEIRFISDDVDLGIFGSRGQIRTAVVALKLAEVSWLKKQTGEMPVMLLDEVLAELDPQRRIDLLELLAVNSQSIMTTTDLQLFEPRFIKQCSVW